MTSCCYVGTIADRRLGSVESECDQQHQGDARRGNMTCFLNLPIQS